MRPSEPSWIRSRNDRPRPEVALGDRDDEAQVGLDHLLLGHQVAALDPLGERDLALGGQQLDAADRPQVEPQRIQAGLDRQVDLRLARRVGRLALRRRRLEPAALGDRGTPVLGVHDVDALILQVRVQLGDLLLGDLHLFKTRGDLLEGQEPPLLAFKNQRAKLVDLDDRHVAREQCFGLSAQTPRSFGTTIVERTPPPGVAPSVYVVCSRAAGRDAGRELGRGTRPSVASLSGFVARVTRSVLSESGVFSSNSAANAWYTPAY